MKSHHADTRLRGLLIDTVIAVGLYALIIINLIG